MIPKILSVILSANGEKPWYFQALRYWILTTLNLYLSRSEDWFAGLHNLRNKSPICMKVFDLFSYIYAHFCLKNILVTWLNFKIVCDSVEIKHAIGGNCLWYMLWIISTPNDTKIVNLLSLLWTNRYGSFVKFAWLEVLSVCLWLTISGAASWECDLLLLLSVYFTRVQIFLWNSPTG